MLHTKLRSPGSVGCHTGPVVGPGLIPVSTQADHGLDREAHARLRLSDSLVLGVMRHVGCAVEQLVDAVPAVGLDDAAVLGLCVLFDDVPVFAEESAWLDQLDGLVQALSRCLDNADRVGVGEGLLADVVRLVEIAVEAAVVEGDVDVEDVAILEDALIGDSVADDFVGRGAH